MASSVEGNSFREHNYNSLLNSKDYICNIISKFNSNRFVGLLVPLPFRKFVGNEWQNNYELTKKFLNKYFNINMQELDPHPISPLGGMFWVRTDALKTLMGYDWKYNDFVKEPMQKIDGEIGHIIERIYSVLAQKDGYYSTFVSSIDYSSAYLNSFIHNRQIAIDNSKKRVEKYAFSVLKNKSLNKMVKKRVFERHKKLIRYFILSFLSFVIKRKNHTLYYNRYQALKKKLKNRDYKIILHSKYFNHKWYKKMYLKGSKIDPISDYIKSTKQWLPLKNPSNLFSNNAYRILNNMLDFNVNPLVHYETVGKYKNYKIRSPLADSLKVEYNEK
jgi:lipopolysaccharide biosynthesis protein